MNLLGAKVGKGPLGLVLGTAQVLPDYGILSKGSEAVDSRQAREVFGAAVQEGFVAVDTAPVYGNAERLIGTYLPEMPVHTKLKHSADPETALRRSLDSLGRNYVDVVYIHEELSMNTDQRRLIDYLGSVRGTLVGEIGASVYDLDEYSIALDVQEISVIQVPMNPLDRRFSASVLGSAHQLGKRIVARSIFLQGILLADPQSLPASISHLSGFVFDFQSVAKAHRMSFVSLALAFTRANSAVSQVVVGARTPLEVKQIARASVGEQNSQALEALMKSRTPEWPATDPRGWK